MRLGHATMITWRARHTSHKWERVLLVAVCLFVAAWLLIYLRAALGGWLGAHLGWDFGHYLVATERWLSQGSPYDPRFIAEPFVYDDIAFIHPPVALVLFAPFLLLPAVLWWTLPLAIVGWILWAYRPSAIGLTAILLIIALPLTLEKVLVGNSIMWVTAFVGLGIRFGWAWALLIIKPLFAPLILLGAADRRTWIGLVAVALFSGMFGTLWLEWAETVRNFRGPPAYTLLDLPMALIPIVAWLARSPERVAAVP